MKEFKKIFIYQRIISAFNYHKNLRLYERETYSNKKFYNQNLRPQNFCHDNVIYYLMGRMHVCLQ